MRFLLSAEQHQFAAGLHDLLGKTEPAVTPWPALADMGVTALAVPARFGGLAADPADLVVCFEQLGRHAVPGPVIESIAVVPNLPGVDAWLPALAEGRAVATVAMPPHVPYALDADRADLVLAVAGNTVHRAEPVAQLSSVDRSRRLFTVSAKEILAEDDTDDAFRFGVLACAAYLLGTGRAMLDLATEHAGRRVQFGRPIGGFQAVKHLLANALVGLELARPLLFGAALSMADRDVSAAKVACADAAHRAGRIALQVHGAVGYTSEHPLGRYLTRVTALRQLWGTNAVHRARVMAALEPVSCTR